MKTSHFLLLSLFFFISCSESSIETETEIEGTLFRVNSYTESCQGFILQECLLIQRGEAIGTQDWTYLYEGINGFDFVPGFIYTLDVKITERNPPPQDVGKYEYTLIKIIEKTAVN